MKKGYLIVVGIVGGSLGLLYLSRKSEAATPALIGPRTVLAIGDSLTASKAYCHALSTELPLQGTVACRGLPGQGTGAILADFKINYPPAALVKYTDVVVLAGVNDIASGRSFQTITHNLTSIYNLIKQSGARVVAVKLTPWYSYKYRPDWEEMTQKVNQWIASSSLPDAVVDTYHLGDFQGRLLDHLTSGDGLHLNQSGSQMLASLIMTQGF